MNAVYASPLASVFHFFSIFCNFHCTSFPSPFVNLIPKYLIFRKPFLLGCSHFIPRVSSYCSAQCVSCARACLLWFGRPSHLCRHRAVSTAPELHRASSSVADPHAASAATRRAQLSLPTHSIPSSSSPEFLLFSMFVSLLLLCTWWHHLEPFTFHTHVC